MRDRHTHPKRLFQTEDYIRAIAEATGLDNIDARVAVRLKRQECLRRDPPLHLWAMLDEGVLRQPIGSPEIMRGQLARLLELAALPTISIRIVPQRVGVHPGRDGAFHIMTVDGADVAYIEASEEGRLVVDATDVRSYRSKFDRISDRALPVDASAELIQQVMETFR